MTDGVRFTITTVEFQDGPYQGANIGEPVPDPPGTPTESTSDPTTEDSGEPVAWGSLVVFLRLGGAGDALALDVGDVDLRQKLAAGGTAAIGAETDLADLDAIEGLYPPKAADTARSGTVNFQLVVTAPAGEQVSTDGITWTSEAAFPANSPVSLIQTYGATGISSSSAPISATAGVQRRKGSALRTSGISAAGSVPMRMSNPVPSYQVLTGTEAAAAGLPQAVLTSSGTVASDSRTDGNTITITNTLTASDADAVTTAGTGATALDAYNATTLADDAWQISYSGSNTIGGGGCADSVPAETITGGSSAGPVKFSSSLHITAPTSAQLAAISTSDRIASDINYYQTKMRAATSWISDVSGAGTIGPTENLGANNPGILGVNPYCASASESGPRISYTMTTSSGISVGADDGTAFLSYVKLYIGTFLVKAAWP